MQPPAPSPYREPMEQPAPRRSVSPLVGVALNVFVFLVLASAFGACSHWGFSEKHLSDDSAFWIGAVAALVCVAATIAAGVAFARSMPGYPVGRVLAIVASSLFGLGASILSWFFWSCASSPAIVPFGAWGRPLRLGRRAVQPGVRASSEWARGPRPEVAALEPSVRELLRDLWLHDARKEHASVPAFGQVAWQLVALGAPSDVVRRAHRCAIQEIDHAERCFALASAYAGRDLGVQAMPAMMRGGAELPRDEARALEKVAIEALVDGALLEDYNAELAATALEDVVDEAARAALVRIVEDEREHAALAWDIIAFCVARGGDPVRAALRATIASISPKPVPAYAPDLLARIEALADRTPLHEHGRVRLERAEPVFRERLAFVTRELEAICAREAA